MAWGAGTVLGPIATAIRRRVFGSKTSAETYATSVDVATIASPDHASVETTLAWVGPDLRMNWAGATARAEWVGAVVGGD